MLSISRGIGIKATNNLSKLLNVYRQPSISKRFCIRVEKNLPNLLSLYRPSCIRFLSFEKNSPYFGNDHCEIALNVKSYQPNEINVKVIENEIIIEAKHEENAKDNYHSTEIVEKYILPIGYDLEKVTTSLSSDGILQIRAPTVRSLLSKHRIIDVLDRNKLNLERQKRQKK